MRPGSRKRHGARCILQKYNPSNLLPSTGLHLFTYMFASLHKYPQIVIPSTDYLTDEGRAPHNPVTYKAQY